MNRRAASEQLARGVALALLALMAATILLTLVELAERGAPWSQSGYAKGKHGHALGSPPLVLIGAGLKGRSENA
jgi:hypothetical protein